jgi:hypothetical protein
MRCGDRGAELGLVQRRDEEGMIGPLDRANPAVGLGAGDAHPVARGQLVKPGRQAVVARGELHHPRTAGVQGSEPRVRRQLNRDLLTVQRARQAADDRRAARPVLGMGRVVDAGQGAGMF